MKIGNASPTRSRTDKAERQSDYTECRPVLKRRTQPDTAIVQHREERRQGQPNHEMRKIDGFACNSIQLDAMQSREEIPGDASNGDRFPGTDDVIRQQHHPSGGIADGAREDRSGICDLSCSLWHRPHKMTVYNADWQQHCAADDKTENGAERTTAPQPVVHHDQPADADHGAETERKEISQAELTRERNHR